MAYPFRKMTTRELRERLWDKGKRKVKPESRPKHDGKIKPQEEICKS